MRRILLVEDAVDFQSMVKKSLGSEFEVVVAGTAAAGWEQLASGGIELILLDVGLPDESGFEFCSRVRQQEAFAALPIIFLTVQSGVSDKVLGFSVGADDYVVKPFEPLELKARVNAKFAKMQALVKGPVQIDLIAHRARLRLGDSFEPLNLTPIEFKLLAYFLRNEGRTLTRDQILNNVWGQGEEVFDRSIDKHVCALRAKLGAAADLLETVPTVGYRYSVGENSAPSPVSSLASAKLSPHLDESTLLRLREMSTPGEEDFLNQLITQFIEVGEGILEKAQSALEKSDTRTLARLCHKFHGSAQNIGAMELSDRCAEFERNPPRNPPDLSKAVAEIEEEFRAVRRSLQKQWKR